MIPRARQLPLAVLAALALPAGAAVAAGDGSETATAADTESVRVEITAADCRRVTRHEPAADVAYEPGVDVDGDPVAPADLGDDGTDLAERLLDRELAFDLDLNPMLFAGNKRLEKLFGNAVIDFGRVVYDPETGRLSHDGAPLDDPQAAAVAAACRARLGDGEGADGTGE